MADSIPVEVSSDQSESASDQASQCSEYNPDDESDVVFISTSEDSDDGGELSDAEIDHESVEEEPSATATEEARYNKVVKLVSGGADLNGLRLEDCKAYLRKHGLRLTGTKLICIQRIQEHMRIKDGGGQKIYPRSSFVINCTGDVCTGDVVLFTQKVYEKFDIVTRGGAHPPLGKRTIAGRVVKESYGAAKQQHTFTVEILWSIGVKALPPLYPLLIKGRNLYRLRTSRQPWPNEAEREKVLAEKHARGAEARNSRAAAKARRYGSKGHKYSQNSHSSEPPRKRHKPANWQGSNTFGKPLPNRTGNYKSQQPHKKVVEPKTNSCPSPTSPLPANVGNTETFKGAMTATSSTQITRDGNGHTLSKLDCNRDQLHQDEIHRRQMGRPAGTGTIHRHVVNAEAQRLIKIPPAVNCQFGSRHQGYQMQKRLPIEPHRNPSQVWMPVNRVANGLFVPSFNGYAGGISERLHGNPSSMSSSGSPRSISGGLSGNIRGISLHGNPTSRSGGFLPPQGSLGTSHIAMQSHMYAGVPSNQASSRTSGGSFACSSSGCHDLGARDCVNSACSRCCQRIGRRCKRHRIF